MSQPIQMIGAEGIFRGPCLEIRRFPNRTLVAHGVGGVSDLGEAVRLCPFSRIDPLPHPALRDFTRQRRDTLTADQGEEKKQPHKFKGKPVTNAPTGSQTSMLRL
jgi:hypothetical protein